MSIKYVALDVHQASTTASVRSASGKVMRREVLETTSTALQTFLKTVGRPVDVALEEEALAQWLYDALQHHVDELIVCDPRQNALLLAGSKTDRADADKLSELLRLGALRPIYHAKGEVAELSEHVRSYETLVEDSVRVMLRIKAIFRGLALSTRGERLYRPERRAEVRHCLEREPALVPSWSGPFCL
jgi:hypothetical protein